jgi:hypothetical protein
MLKVRFCGVGVTNVHYVSSCLVNNTYDLCRSPKQVLLDSAEFWVTYPCWVELDR